jgi:hypothetical protein
MTTTTGEMLKEAGCALALSNTPPQWQEYFEMMAAALIEANGSFTAEEVVTLIGPPPRPNQTGAVCRQYARSRRLVAQYEKAKSPSAHARIITRWYEGGSL